MKKIAKQLNSIADEFNQIIIVDNNQIINLLQMALKDEILATYQYWAAMHMSKMAGKIDADEEFEAHYKEEWEHANMLIERIKQLGGFPDVNLLKVLQGTEKNSSFLGAPTHDVCELLKITWNSEKEAIETYKTIIELTCNCDPTTNRIAKQILEDEEQHKYDIEILMEEFCCCK